MKTARTRRHPSLNREYRVLYVDDVMEILGIGPSKAYQIIRQLNDEIEAKGYLRPVSGRVSEAYFRERFYLGDDPFPTSAENKERRRKADDRIHSKET